MENALPRLGVGDVHHSSEDSTIGGRAEDRRAQNAIEMFVGVRVVAENELLGGAAETLADVRVEAALPVAVAKRGRRRCDRELVRNEIVVGDRIRGEMSEIAETEGSQGFRFSVVVDLEADVPGVRMSAGGGVLLGDARVRRDRSVEEVDRKSVV